MLNLNVIKVYSIIIIIISSSSSSSSISSSCFVVVLILPVADYVTSIETNGNVTVNN